MNLPSGTREIVRAVSEGTGLSQEEIVILVAEALVVTAVFGVLRTVDALLDAWPIATGGVQT